MRKLEESRSPRYRVETGMIIAAVVLLLGIVVLAVGYLAVERMMVCAGLLITLAGVLTGIRRLIVGGGHGKKP